jgi:glycosyltransferase involved in cell wall biosynthesis
MPHVSVVITTYNYAHFLPRTLDSVLAQTFQDWECVIVDNCSRDHTPEVVAAYTARDRRFRYLRNQTNKGEAGSRNVGNGAAAGELIAVLDGDDWWHPEKLERQVRAMRERPGTVLSFTGRIDIRAETPEDPGEEIRRLTVPEADVANLGLRLRQDNLLHHSSVLHSRQAVREVGGYEERASYANAVDWDLWLRLMHQYGAGSFVYLGEPLLYYRLHGSSLSGNSARVTRGERSVVVRNLLRGAWALRHPVEACRVMDAQIHRETSRHLMAGNRRSAFTRAVASTLLFGPIRRWRWQRAAEILRKG